MDEVFARASVEFVGGTFCGCEDGAPTKTLLCTMLKSVAGRYHDIITLTPITSINSKITAKVYHQLLEVALKIGFDVTVTLVDGHNSNCKFFKNELYFGMMNLWIANPLNSANRIFLLFDPTHLFKNFYCNLINKEYFECPTFEGIVMKPNVQHINDIYNIELGRNPKIAYRLSDKVLRPATIEKNNVSLADSFFHESTISALKTYAKENDCPEYHETVNFLEHIRRWWNLLNVKSTLTCKAKRDDNRQALNVDNLDHLNFLTAFSSWLEDW